MRYYQFSVKQLQTNPSDWKEWSSKAGIYYFIQGKAVKYIGRALPSVTLGSRVKNQINAFGDPKWDNVIKDGDTICGVVVFPEEEWYWIPALEVYLIEKLHRPEFNKRFA